MPWAEIGIAALVLGLIAANIYAFYKLGGSKAASARDSAEGSLKADRKVHDAVEQARRDPVRIDSSWLRRGSGTPPAGKDPGRPPADR